MRRRELENLKRAFSLPVCIEFLTPRAPAARTHTHLSLQLRDYTSHSPPMRAPTLALAALLALAAAAPASAGCPFLEAQAQGA